MKPRPPTGQAADDSAPSPHRRHTRIETDVRVDFTGASEVLLDHQVVNISLGGAALRVPATEPVGQIVELAIRFPDLDAEVEVTGDVVWVKEEPLPEIGVRFSDLSDADRETLNRYLYAIGKKEKEAGSS